MAYTKLRELILLAQDLQATSIGLTFKEMGDKIAERGQPVSLKTVKRMMYGIEELGFEVEQYVLDSDHHLTKRWKIRSLPRELMVIESNEKAALEQMLRGMQEGVEARALTKILGDVDPLSVSATSNLSEVIDRTRHTGNVAPRTRLDDTQMRTMERAIEGFFEVKFKYRSQKAQKAVQRQVRPLGILFGRFTYIVASTGNRAPIPYRADLITDLEITKEYFNPKEGFSFKDWAAESFGVFHGDALWDIKIRFSKEVADRAEKVQFHASQKMVKQKDGSLVMFLKCRGHRELIWELLHPDWLGNVKIESPERLQEEYLGQLESAKLAV